MKGFKQFVLRGNVVDLAVAVIIGAAFGAVVSTFVAAFLTPLIAAIFGKPDFAALHFTVHHSTFRYGLFINAVISFLIIAAVLYYLVVLPVTTLVERTRRGQDPDVPTKQCAECLSSIPEAATRCAFCTVLQPV